MKRRLDIEVAQRGLAASRSQAESWIKLGRVSVAGKVVAKPGYFVSPGSLVELRAVEQYVSRAGLKLASVAAELRLDFTGKTVLDVGSSTGGFTDFALKRGARKVVAVDVGTDQLHPNLRGDERVELHEKTDIRQYKTDEKPDIVVIDLSFISLREVLPHVAMKLSGPHTQIVAMVKPQFEAGKQHVTKGIIKNDTVRRQILSDFEQWAKAYCSINDKRDSEITGAKGNRERFYVLAPLHI